MANRELYERYRLGDRASAGRFVPRRSGSILDFVPATEIRELIFEVREADEGGYVARALGESIFAEAENWPALENEIRDAVECHYEVGERPAVVRLHFVRDQVLAL